MLVGALAACDAALDRDLAADLKVELPPVDSVVDMWDEARDERNGLLSDLLGDGERQRGKAGGLKELRREGW